jgi:hypothetical protein
MHTGKTMQWDTISDQWLWIGAAVVFVILVAAIAARCLRKPKKHDKAKSEVAAQNGWTATGRVDFADLQSKGDFILQVEETRIVDTVGGVEHREIRWRKATLDEAKDSVGFVPRATQSYHDGELHRLFADCDETNFRRAK